MQPMYIQYTIITDAYKYASTHSRDQPEKLRLLEFLHTHTDVQTKPIYQETRHAPGLKSARQIRSSNYQSKV